MANCHGYFRWYVEYLEIGGKFSWNVGKINNNSDVTYFDESLIRKAIRESTLN